MTLTHTDSDGCLCARCVWAQASAQWFIRQGSGNNERAALVIEQAFAAREAELLAQQPPPIASCPQCGSGFVSETEELERFQYGPEDDAPWIECRIPVYQCDNACTGTHGEEPFRWMDWKAEIIKDAAVREALVRGRVWQLEAREAELRVWRSRLAQLVGQPDEDCLPQRIEEEIRSLRSQPTSSLAENRALREAVDDVLFFDWGENDDDAFAAIEKLRVVMYPPPTDPEDAR